jgi:lipopolysaccharide export LptBFGC system permease protein LptF
MQQDFIDKLAESPAKLIPAAFITVLLCWICLWVVFIALDAQASKLDQKIANQQSQRIVQSTYNQ